MLSDLEVKLQLAMEKVDAIDNRTKVISRKLTGIDADNEEILSLLDGDIQEDEGQIRSVQDIFTEMNDLLENLKNVADKVEAADTRVFDVSQTVEGIKNNTEATAKFLFWSFVTIAALFIGNLIYTGATRGQIQTQAERPQGTGSQDPGGLRQISP